MFQGGREQKEQTAPQETTEKPQSKRKTARQEKDRVIRQSWTVAILNGQIFLM